MLFEDAELYCCNGFQETRTVFVGKGVTLCVTVFVEVTTPLTGDAVTVECIVVDLQEPCTNATGDKRVSISFALKIPHQKPQACNVLVISSSSLESSTFCERTCALDVLGVRCGSSSCAFIDGSLRTDWWSQRLAVIVATEAGVRNGYEP